MMQRRDIFALGGAIMASGIAATAGLAQQERSLDERDAERIRRETAGSRRTVPHRRIRTVDLFQSPEGYPNAIDATKEGLWVAEQRTPEDIGVSNDAYLVDWNGKVLRKVRTDSFNTSGMAFGDGHLWMGVNGGTNGIIKTTLDGESISRRQIPLGPPNSAQGGELTNGGGTHGVLYHQGKVYITALRLRGILRVDAETWEPELLIPCQAPRLHDLAWDDGTIWIITGTASTDLESTAGLARYDATSGMLLETAEFVEGSADPHGLTVWNGTFYGSDAGIHPGWPFRQSKSSGMIFRMEFV